MAPAVYMLYGTQCIALENGRPDSTVRFPQTLTNIKAETFKHCPLLVTMIFNECHALKVIEGEAFYACKSLQTLELHSCGTLNEIGCDAIHGCRSLKQVTLSFCLTTLQASAFNRCG